MAIVDSEVDICNLALIRLGANVISSLDESSDVARMCSHLWPSVRDDVLSLHPWNCAVKRASLARLSSTPETEFSYMYQLPTDFLRLLDIDGVDWEDFRVETYEGNKVILCDVTTCVIRYIFRNEAVVTYDPGLVDVLAARMEAELAFGVTRSASRAQLAWQLYERKKLVAQSVDAQQEPPSEGPTPSLVSVRY